MSRSSVFTYGFTGTGTLGAPNFEQLNTFNGTLDEGSGVCAPSAVNHIVARVINNSFSNDQYAKATISGFGFISTDYYAGVIVRAAGSPNVDSSRSYYFFYACANSGGPYQTVLGKVVNGTVTSLNTANQAWADGDTISLEVSGTTLTAYRNDVALGGSWTQTDSSLATGRPGMIASGSGVLTLDNLDVGDMTGGGTINTKTQSDSLSMSDGTFRSLERGRFKSDTLSLTDGFARSIVRGRVASDALIVFDAEGVFRVYGVTLNDSVDPADQVLRGVQRGRVVQDFLNLLDSLTGTTSNNKINTITLSDQLSLVDALMRATAICRMTSDSLTVFDQNMRVLYRYRMNEDALSPVDQLLSSMYRNRALGDAFSLSDELLQTIPISAYQAVPRIVLSREDNILLSHQDGIILGGYAP